MAYRYSKAPLVNDDLCSVRGVADVESQFSVVVFHDGAGRVGQSTLLEQGNSAAPKTTPGHSGPEIC